MRKNNQAPHRQVERNQGDVLPSVFRASRPVPRVPEFYYPVKWQDIARVNEEVENLPPMERICADPERCKIHGAQTKSE